MSTILITGGNKGLGYEAARQLIERGNDVYIACRDQARGEKAATELGAKLVVMDVTDQASVERAAAEISEREGKIDVLVNNAGVTGTFKPATEIDESDMMRVYNTNVFGIVRVTKTFVPLLEKSDNPVIVNVSSGMGSFGTVMDPTSEESQIISLDYCSAKSAVSMLTLQYSKALPTFKVNCVDPRGTATDLNNHMGKQTIPEGAEVIISMASIGKDGPTGKFFNRFGEIPW